MRLILAAAAAALGLIGAPAAALDQEPTPTDEVVVVEAPTATVLRRFVNEMAVAPRHQDQLSRWDRKICPGVAGLRTRYAQFVIDRMAQRAIDVGLDVGAPGCSANVLIVVTRDPDSVARDLADNHPDAMGYFSEPLTSSLGRRALASFVASDAPVRWWHVNHTTGANGMPISEPSAGGAYAGGEGGIFEMLKVYPLNLAGGGSSRMQRSTREDFGAAFVIIDARRLEDIHFDFGALADYVAMVTLAQLDPNADTASYPTILNLFSEPPRAVGGASLTDWDLAYLHGLYDMARDRSDTAQRGEISRTMTRDLSSPPEEAEHH